MRWRLVAWIAFGALVTAIAYTSRFTEGKPDRDALYKWTTAIGELVLFAIIIGVTLAIAGSQRQLLALRRPFSWKRAAAVAVPVFILVFLAITAMDQALHGSDEQGLVPKHWQSSHAGAFAANFVVVALVAPFAEELLFRGLGVSLLYPWLGKWATIIAIGVAFGLYHGLVEALPELALFGSALAWLRLRTGSVFPGMFAHATFNAVGLLSVFF
jgi:membrane protease YdiL (CAAX protease family)